MPNTLFGLKATKAKIAYSVDGTAPPEFHAPDHRPNGVDPLSLPADITPGQALGWDGTKYKGYDIAAAGGPDLLNNLFYQTFFESLDGIVQYKSGSAAITLLDNAVYLNTMTTPNSRARLYKRISVPYPWVTWEKKRELLVRADLLQTAAGNLQSRIWTGYDYNKYGFGFLVEGNVVYGECAGGSPVSQVVLETIPPGAYDYYKSLRAVFTPGSKVEFYIDGVKKGELTSNLPTGLTEAYYIMWFHLQNLTASNEQAWISMWKLFQEA